MNHSKKRYLLSAALIGSPALIMAEAHAAVDLGALAALVQKNRVVIGNNASIDDANPETVAFTTEVDHQLVELSLRATRLSDTFITAIDYPQPTRQSLSLDSAQAAPLTGPRAAAPITFGNLHVVLDGCDITAALVAQCNTNQCWDTIPNPLPTSFTGTFATQIFLNLSALNPATITGCTAAAGQTSFFDAAHPSHTLQFSETVQNQGKGGSLYYQVSLYHRTF